MYLKLTENGGSRIIEVVECRFSRAPCPNVVYRKAGENEEHADLISDAFVISDEGVTIEKFFLRPRSEGMNK